MDIALKAMEVLWGLFSPLSNVLRPPRVGFWNFTLAQLAHSNCFLPQGFCSGDLCRAAEMR